MNGSPFPAGRRLIASWAGLGTLVLLAGFLCYIALSVSPLGAKWLPHREPAAVPAGIEAASAPALASPESGASRSLVARLEKQAGAWLRQAWSDDLARTLGCIAAILVLLLAEKALPVVRSQSPLSNGFFVDLGYTVFYGILFLGLFAPFYDRYLRFLYEHSLAHLEFSLGFELPVLVPMVLYFLLFDFIAWLHHLIRHKVAFFWEFHAVHHSQEQMNALTDYRVHPIDFVVAAHIKIVPLMFFTNSLHLVGSYLFISWLLPKIYNANLKTKFGLLRYILVTPQSHRVHHSRHPDHVDTNFGVILSIWDHIFRTQYRNYDIYPETGIGDRHYPNERGRNPLVLPWLFARQHFHPILRVLGRAG